MATLEREIIAECRVILKNPKLRVKDMQEWSSGPINPHDGEIVVKVPSLGLNAAFKNESDKRSTTDR